MTKTTIDIDSKLWQDFSIKVIRERGLRAKNDVIAALIGGYVRTPEKTVKEIIDGVKERCLITFGKLFGRD